MYSSEERRRYLRTIGAAAVASSAGCLRALSRDPRDESPSIEHRVRDRRFQTRRVDEKWEALLVRGVNLGMAKPGTFPGEAAITKEEYARWLALIGEMNANVVRVYTLHPPAFYEALAEHNATAADPLFVLHGNWIAQATLVDRADAFDPEVVGIHEEGIRNVVDAVHGNARVPERRGHAGGSYEVDVSPYVLGYVVGIEWPPEVVEATDRRNRGIDEYAGEYVETDGATPFEHWLARRLDGTIAYEHDRYGDRRPVSFTNWPTTDHLDHPAEPQEMEDAVSVTANHLLATDAFEPGLFATYHVYPYYPDFLNYEPAYVEYVTEDGDRSSYRGYLADLVAANDHPVLVGEFGVPASRGMTHRQVHGFDQGHHTEREQGELDAKLYEHVVNADTLGGVLFTWQDEWFKRTWNTMDFTNPDRRPFWSDAQTCEQAFGMLGFEPDGSPDITLSGRPSEWADATELHAASARPRVALEDGYDAQRTLTGLHAAADARYLYLRLDYADLAGLDWERTNTLVLLNVKPDQGITTLPFGTGLTADAGVDFLVRLAGPDRSRVLVDSYYDGFYYLYGEQLEMIPAADYASERDNGRFHPIRLALNHELHLPDRDEVIPFDGYETGRLRFGIGDPDDPAYDSLADVCVTPEENVIELRLPWLLLNFRDPSRREVLGDLWETGLEEGVTVDGISVAAVTVDPDGDPATSRESGPDVTDSLPELSGGRLPLSGAARFTWDEWDQPAYRERLKRSYDVVRERYARYA